MDLPRLFIYIIAGTGGLIVGSFFNVVLARLGKSSGILWGRSECPDCGHVLAWYDLAPILSFILLTGRCRYCRKQISWRYPLIEALTAVVLLAGIHFNVATVDLALILGLLLLALFDLQDFILPDIIMLPLGVLALGRLIFLHLTRTEIATWLTSAILMGLFFAVISLGSKGRWMGLGDAKLVLVIGLALGYPLGFLAVVAGIWLATLLGVVLLLLQQASPKTPLPLGTFLALATIGTIIFSQHLQFLTRYFRW